MRFRDELDPDWIKIAVLSLEGLPELYDWLQENVTFQMLDPDPPAGWAWIVPNKYVLGLREEVVADYATARGQATFLHELAHIKLWDDGKDFSDEEQADLLAQKWALKAGKLDVAEMLGRSAAENAAKQKKGSR